MTLPLTIWILLAAAAICCAVGFYKYVYFISIGYGFAIAGCGIALLIMYPGALTWGTLAACILFVIYGCRLSGYLLYREMKSASYNRHMKGEIKSGDSMGVGVKIALWISCAILYVLMVSPVFYRLVNGNGTDAFVIIGLVLMAGGIVLESASDLSKSMQKKKNPGRICDHGLFRFVRCPNYLGELILWTGVFVSGITSFSGAGQWIIAILGYLGIIYVMFSGARRLELRQNRLYADDPDYWEFVHTVPIMIPFIPLYSVAKYRFLVL